MALSRCYSVLGDSNVQRNVNPTAFRTNPLLKSAQIIPCGHLEIFAESLNKVRDSSTVCVVACLTNFLTSIDGSISASVSGKIAPLLSLIVESLKSVCQDNPNRFHLISAPMYRDHPVWYREALPEILLSFSQALSFERPDNLRILPSFPNPVLEQDGVHLTSYSGLEYLIHLFDSAESIMEHLDDAPEEVLLRQCESTRVLEDRVLILEQDHQRLNKLVENKIAVDAELADFRENERMEDCFMIEGLPLIPPEVSGKEWQELAIKNVKEVIVPLMGKDSSIVVVQNATARYKDAPVKYNVKMSTVAESKAIRTKFGSFFLGQKDGRPPQFKPYSIRNRVTPETNVRLAVLKVLGARYKASNPGSRIQVVRTLYF